MIKFKYIKYKNLLSTGNQWTKIRLDAHPTTLIIGPNGHGKSTMLDALCYACFGKPFRDINLPKLINSINGKEMATEVGFSSGATQYRVVRGLAPKVFEIYRDGILVPQDAAGGDYQTWLEEFVFKYNYKAFTQIVILGSKSFVPFMKLKAADRRNIIDNLLDIDIFTAMAKVAGDSLKKYKDDVAANKVKIDGLMAQIELHKKHKENSEKNTQDQLNVINGEIEVRLKLVDKHKADYTFHNATMEDAYEKLGSDPVALKSKIELRSTERQNKITFYQTHDMCPECDSSLSQNFRDMKIEKLNSETALKANAIKEFEKTFENWQAARTKRGEAQAAENFERHLISKLQGERNELANKKVLSDEMVEISNKLIADLQAATAERKELVENQAYYGAAVALLKDGGVKAEIIRQYLPIINAQINKNLAAMDFFVMFELNEEFEETIKSRYRDEFVYASFSEGEKQKIDIALLFAWRAVAKMKNSVNTNLLIMDEIFDSSLDGAGADLVLSILGTMPEGSNIFVISHRELLHDRFANTVRFEKRNNFSQMVQHEI